MKFWLFLFLVILSFLPTFGAADGCKYIGSDNVIAEFKNCNTDIGVTSDQSGNLSVINENSQFRTYVATIIKRVQVVTSVIAVAIIIWIGLMMVLPVNAEAKEEYKSKVFSVLMGFLIMISATIIINGIINILYELF